MKTSTEFARKLRREQTQAELRAWWLLRNRCLGFKFRRQCPIGPYIVDFLCIEARLIIELDGIGHGDSKQKKHDKERDAFLANRRYAILRVPNGMVFKDPDEFVKQVRAFFPSPAASRHPLPQREG